MIYLKTHFDASNLLRQKAYQEYDVVKPFKQYIRTANGKNKLKKLIERYFSAVGITVECIDVDVDLLVKDEVTFMLKDNDYSIHDYNDSGHIYFY